MKFVIFMILLELMIIPSSVVSSQSATLEDTIFGSTNECSNVCWNNMEIGVTTKSKALEIFYNLPLIVKASDIAENEIESPRYNSESRIVVTWQMQYKSKFNNMMIDDGILYSVHIDPSLDFTLEETIDYFGVPAGTQIRYVVDSENGYRYAPYSLLLYYPKVGVLATFELVLNQDRIAVLSPSLVAQSYDLYKHTDELEAFIELISIYSPDSKEFVAHNQSVMPEWVGLNSILLSSEYVTEMGFDRLIISPEVTKVDTESK